MSKKIIWIDTETTGLDALKAGLVEVACIVEIDGVEVEKILLQINPFTYNRNIEISQEALDVTGKKIDDLKSYESSKAQFHKFIALLSKYIDQYDKNDKFKINGYNTKFDVAFIKEWFIDNDNKYYGAYFDYKELDVFALVGYIKHLGFIDTENEKLKTICEHFGINLDAHKAFDDITATKQLGELLSERFIKDQTEDTLAELEAKILHYYLAEGYKLEKDQTEDDEFWMFEVMISTCHKEKQLIVNLLVNGEVKSKFYTLNTTTKEMFDAAFEYFKIKV